MEVNETSQWKRTQSKDSKKLVCCCDFYGKVSTKIVQASNVNVLLAENDQQNH